jgi:hypothetical protein
MTSICWSLNVILSWFRTDRILRLLFGTVYVNHILGWMGIAVIRVNFWALRIFKGSLNNLVHQDIIDGSESD